MTDSKDRIITDAMKEACEAIGVDPKRLTELTDKQLAELVEAFSEWADLYRFCHDDEGKKP
jgi:hypothetical protein